MVNQDQQKQSLPQSVSARSVSMYYRWALLCLSIIAVIAGLLMNLTSSHVILFIDYTQVTLAFLAFVGLWIILTVLLSPRV